MRSVPYHNFRHVVDVTHCIFRFLRLADKSCQFSIWEQVSLLIAALGHDLDHPGKIGSSYKSLLHNLRSTYLYNSLCTLLQSKIRNRQTASHNMLAQSPLFLLTFLRGLNLNQYSSPYVSESIEFGKHTFQTE